MRRNVDWVGYPRIFILTSEPTITIRFYPSFSFIVTQLKRSHIHFNFRFGRLYIFCLSLMRETWTTLISITKQLPERSSVF